MEAVTSPRRITIVARRILFGLVFFFATGVLVLVWRANILVAANDNVSADVVFGGIGLVRDEWEQRYGPGKSTVSSSAFYKVGSDLDADVIFTSAERRPPQRVKQIGIHLFSARVTEQEVRSLSAQFLPSDAVFVERTSERVRGRTIATDRFASESMGRLFSATCGRPWGSDHRPGDVLVSQMLEGQPERPVVVHISWHCPDR